MLKHSSLSRTDQSRRVHYYKLFRSQRPDLPADQHWQSALSHMFFMDRLRADNAMHAKRSRAARKAWKTRKAAA